MASTEISLIADRIRDRREREFLDAAGCGMFIQCSFSSDMLCYPGTVLAGHSSRLDVHEHCRGGRVSLVCEETRPRPQVRCASIFLAAMFTRPRAVVRSTRCGIFL